MFSIQAPYQRHVFALLGCRLHGTSAVHSFWNAEESSLKQLVVKTQPLGCAAFAQCSQSPTRVATSKVQGSTQQAHEEACEAYLRREIIQTATDVQSCSCQQRCPWVVTQLSKCPQTIGQSWPIKLLHHKSDCQSGAMHTRCLTVVSRVCLG